MSEELADKLARRAEAVFAKYPFWARKASPRAGSRKASPRAGSRKASPCAGFQNREFILKFMRHWLICSYSPLGSCAVMSVFSKPF